MNKIFYICYYVLVLIIKTKKNGRYYYNDLAYNNNMDNNS